jgi:hypothetical protein
MNQIDEYIKRLECNSVRYSNIASPYCRCLINLAKIARENPKIEDGFLYIGDIDLEFLKMKNKPIPENYEPKFYWLDLSSVNDLCLRYKIKTI